MLVNIIDLEDRLGDRGSSPSRVTGKITDTEKERRRPDPRLAKKTYGLRTDKREKSAEAFFEDANDFTKTFKTYAMMTPY